MVLLLLLLIFGVFSQTVINGFNGFRCNTLDDFVQACKKWVN